MRAVRRLVLLACVAGVAGCKSKTEEPAPTPASAATTPTPPAATTTATTTTATGSPRPSGSARKSGLAGLTAVEILTENAPADDALPMVVALHEEHTRAETIASLFAHQEARTRLLAFRAPIVKSDTAAAWFPTLEEVHGDVDAYSRGIREVTERLAFTLTEAKKKRSTWGKPIVVGISQGGIVALELALTHPEHAGNVLVVGSILPRPLWPEKRDVDASYPKITFFHTLDDEIIRYADAQTFHDKLRSMGFPVRLKHFAGPHDYTFAIRLKLHDDLQEAIKETAAGDRFPR